MVEAKRVAGYVGAGVGVVLTGYALHEAFKGFGVYDFLGNLLLPWHPKEGYWTDEYRCSGKTLQRMWVYPDGTQEWFDVGYNHPSCKDEPDGDEGMWTHNYKCEGRRRLREWINPDGTREWRTWETTSDKCWVNIYGKIYEEVVMQPIAYAKTTLKGRNYGGDYTTHSKSDGSFKFDNLIPDFYDIETTAEGYEAHKSYNIDLTMPERSFDISYLAGPLTPIGVGAVEVVISPSQAGSHRDWCCGTWYWKYWLPRHDAIYCKVTVWRSDGEPFKDAIVAIEAYDKGWGGFECPANGVINGIVERLCDAQGKCQARYFAKYEGGGDHPNNRQVIVTVMGYKTGPTSMKLFKNPIVKYANLVIDGSLGSATCYAQCEKDFYPDGTCQWHR